ncbi:unnamed protein product [Trichobilharzia szidati]|nr:unnamed protein product [Trichobilharzia szidati]
MFIYPRENLVYTLAAALCIVYPYLVISLSHLLLLVNMTLIHTQQMRHDQYNLPKSILHRSENFQPCIEQSDPAYPIGKMIICNEEATLQFGNRLPIIITQSDHSIINNNEYIISTIIIEDNPNIEICSTGTFANVMMMSPTPLTTTTAMHPGSRVERKLLLTGLSLHIFQHGCFKGLSELNILHIKNYQSTTDSLKKLSGNLFQELKHLKNLKVLHLENIDLSIGIPQYAFYGWMNQLKVITLINNNLNTIHNEAFPSIVGTDNNNNNGLRELRLEKQNEDGWKLLENSNQWGRYLYALRVFSLEGTSLRKTTSSTNMRLNKNINMVKIDFGDYVNRHLEYLNVQNCELTHLVNTTTTTPIIIDNQYKSSDDLIGLNLNYLGGQLKQLYIGYNKFIDFNFLHQIKHFRNLRLLSINGNQLPVGTLPRWFNTQWPYLHELQIASNGITYIPTDTISSNLKVLHLSENPLELFDYNWIQQNDDLHGSGDYDDREIKLSELHLNSIRLISVQLEGSQANWERIFQPVKYSLEHLSLINCQLEANMFIKSSNNTATNNNTLNRNDIYLNLGLNNLKQLKSLILSGNYLEYIPPGLFQSLHQLDNLILTQNQLLTIHEPRMIREQHDGNDDKSGNSNNKNNNRMHRLLRLDLSHNNLITLERCAYALGFSRPFESILPLQPTWLAENGEQQQQQRQEQEQQHYEESSEYTSNQIYWRGGLNIIGNPFICDCRLAWFRQFIDQMSKTLIAQNEKQSFGFKSYLNEAINFTCYGANQLTGRYFLTLTPNDLYTIDHVDCQSRPDIYGYDVKSLDSLQPCWKLNRTFSPRLEQILETKQGMLMRSRFLSGSHFNPSVVLENATAVSNEAMTLIIIAGVAALCFIIVSIIIIIWLCIRLKRKTEHRPTTTSLWHKRFYRGRLNEVSCGGAFKRLHSPCCSLSMCDFISCTNCNPKKCTKHCSLCSCTVYPKRTSISTSETDNLMRAKLHRSEDNSVMSTGMLRNHHANNNDRYYYDKVNKNGDGVVIDSIYSDTNDLDTQETQSLNRYTGSNNNNNYNSSRRRLLLHDQRNRRYRQTKQSNNFGDETKFSPSVRNTSQISNTANSNIIDSANYRTSNKYTYEKPLYTSASVHTLLNVDHEHLIQPLHQPSSTDLLPPVPPPRKSKSIGDLLQNTRVESATTTIATSPRATTPLNLRRSAKQLAMRKVGEQSVVQQSTDIPVHLLRHYDTRRKHSPAYTSSIRRSVLPWRDKSADNNDNNGGRSMFINNRPDIKNVFRRNRLVVSARPRLENTQEKNNVNLRNNWLSASRRRLRKTCEWLKRDRHSKTRNSSHSSIQEEKQSVLQPARSKDDIKFLGPELPKPFFLLPKQEVEYAIPVVDSKRTTHTDYLPMSPGYYSDNRPLEGRSNEATSSSPIKKSPIDEYVTDLIHIQNMNYPNLILSDTIKLPLQQQLPITTMKQTTSGIIDPITMTTTPTTSTTATTTTATVPTANTSPTTSNKPIRPPRHQKLQIAGDLYSIQTFANSNNNLTTGLEVNKNKRAEKYLPLPPPPPPPPFMLNRTELLKVNNNNNTSTLIGSSKASQDNYNYNNDNTSEMNNANLSLFPLPPLLSPKPRNISIKPLRSAKLPRQPQSSATTTATTTTAVTTTQPKTSNFPTGQYNQSLRGPQRAQQPTYNIEDDNNNNTKGTDRQQDNVSNTRKNTG